MTAHFSPLRAWRLSASSSLSRSIRRFGSLVSGSRRAISAAATSDLRRELTSSRVTTQPPPRTGCTSTWTVRSAKATSKHSDRSSPRAARSFRTASVELSAPVVRSSRIRLLSENRPLKPGS